MDWSRLKSFFFSRNSLQEADLLAPNSAFDNLAVVSGSRSLVRVHLKPELNELVDLAISIQRLNMIHKFFVLCGRSRNAFKFENGATFPTYQELSRY